MIKFFTSNSFLATIPYLAITLVSLVSCLTLISNSVPIGDDFFFHIYRDRGTLDALRDGQILPQVDPAAVYGFGHSWNIFYGPLPTYIATFVFIIVRSWAVTFNAVLILSVFLSGIFMFRYIYAVSKKLPIALIAAVLYITAPYHSFDIYSRQAVGEIVSFVFVPIVFHGLWAIGRNKYSGVALLIAGATGLLLTHNLSAIMVAVFALLYIGGTIGTFKENLKPVLLKLFISMLAIIGLTAFFTFPLLEAKQTNLYNIFDPMYTSYAMGMNGPYLNSWRVDASSLLSNTHSVTDFSDTKPFALSGVTIAAFLLVIVSYKRVPKSQRAFWVSCLALSFVSLILTTKIINWNLVPSSLLSVQFPWRFLFIATFFTSIVAAYSLYYFLQVAINSFKVLIRFKKASLVLLLFIVITASITYSSTMIFAYQSDRWDESYDYNSLNGIGGGEYLPKTNRLDAKQGSQDNVSEYLRLHRRQAFTNSNSVKIENYTQSGTHASFTIAQNKLTDEHTTVTLPYFYYPGYKASMVDDSGKHINLVTFPSKEGFVNVLLYKFHNGSIRVHYGLSKATFLGISVTVITIIALTIYFYTTKRMINNN